MSSGKIVGLRTESGGTNNAALTSVAGGETFSGVEETGEDEFTGLEPKQEGRRGK